MPLPAPGVAPVTGPALLSARALLGSSSSAVVRDGPDYVAVSRGPGDAVITVGRYASRAAARSALTRLPYIVKGWHNWHDVAIGRYAALVAFADLDVAQAFARDLPDDIPLVDVIHRGHGVVGGRHYLAYPGG